MCARSGEWGQARASKGLFGHELVGTCMSSLQHQGIGVSSRGCNTHDEVLGMRVAGIKLFACMRRGVALQYRGMRITVGWCYAHTEARGVKHEPRSLSMGPVRDRCMFGNFGQHSWAVSEIRGHRANNRRQYMSLEVSWRRTCSCHSENFRTTFARREPSVAGSLSIKFLSSEQAFPWNSFFRCLLAVAYRNVN